LSDEGERIGGVVQGRVEFRDVCFEYPTRTGQPVLRGLSFIVEPGQFVALVGASGCGKSTTIGLLERFYDPTVGQILVDGKDISKLNVKEYRSQLALVAQEPVLYSGTIRENILLAIEGMDVDDVVVEAACKKANIWEFIVGLPLLLPIPLDFLANSKPDLSPLRLLNHHRRKRDPPFRRAETATRPSPRLNPQSSHPITRRSYLSAGFSIGSDHTGSIG
jgi:ABC-type multidrug transport system fused ATPase/permease subunit